MRREPKEHLPHFAFPDVVFAGALGATAVKATAQQLVPLLLPLRATGSAAARQSHSPIWSRRAVQTSRLLIRRRAVQVPPCSECQCLSAGRAPSSALTHPSRPFLPRGTLHTDPSPPPHPHPHSHLPPPILQRSQPPAPGFLHAAAPFFARPRTRTPHLASDWPVRIAPKRPPETAAASSTTPPVLPSSSAVSQQH
ncbi:hypothetical protein BU26DRAFT_21027 [Trematosphaeria pertusa]|uniref:Uncharacterized protein n=1 Tax=Trematosphaeria pertusa TaxID=390896 RepID=A0A6A6J227_9PLEO|nr:uncharacterized protein BU26DRAFT_21027 [Trematosphaeria pertusa]KAF2256397.1 hypothetical protein BU26DRAFT_21027 [Trematosphaeria pertusa]